MSDPIHRLGLSLTRLAQLREERKADLERHVAAVNAMLTPADDVFVGTEGSGTDDEWTGLEDAEQPPPLDHEAEYIDEDKYTTVTVEAMDVSKEGLFKAEQDQKDPDEPQDPSPSEQTEETDTKKRSWTKEKPKDKDKDKDKAKARKKKRNFRYESKSERKVTRVKERSRGKKQARERRTGA